MLCISEEHNLSHTRIYSVLYSTARNTGSMSHKEIQDAPRSRKCTVCLKNNICVTSEDAIYCTPYQEIQEALHIRIYVINALSGNAIYVWRIIYTPHQKIQYIVRHIMKYKMYVTSGNTGNAVHMLRTIYTPHQEIQDIIRHIRKKQEIRHIRKYRMYTISGNAIYYYAPHQEMQEVRHIRKYKMYAISGKVIYVWRTIYTPLAAIQYIVRHIKKYEKYATSGNTGCTPYHEMLCMCEEQYTRHIRIYNRFYATSGNARNTSHQ